MATITLRSTKGSPLTNTEVDNNFTNLNTDKIESTYSGALNSLTGGSAIVTVSSTTGITTGVWKATLIGATYGGTGVNNGSNTITVGGNLSTANAFTTSGAYGLTLTATATTNATLPAGTKTLLATDGSGSSLTFGTGTLSLAGNLTTTGSFTTSFTQQASTTLTLPAATDTLVGRASTDTLTNKTWNGVAIGATYGGTGQSSYAVGDILYAPTTTTVGKLAAGTSGYLLTANGAGVAPTWQAAPSSGISTGKSIAMAIIFGF